MDRSTVITLIASQTERDDYGVFQTTETRREVFAQVDSVTRAEFFDGGRNGLNPEYKFTLFDGDYRGEDTLVYDERPYAVYRTFRARTDEIELYAERKGGTNGKGNN